MRLQDRIAIVTGGGRGIGKAIAIQLAKDGADVVVATSTLGPANEVIQQVESLGRKGIAIRTDVSKVEEVRLMVKTTLDKFGRIDILVNNAGGSARGRMSLFSESTEDTWDYVLGVNLKGVFYCCREVIGHMIERRSGNIVNIGSLAGMIGLGGQVDYSAAKAGVIGFTKALAKEVASSGIRVNCVSPGTIINDSVKAVDPSSKGGAVLEEIRKSTGLGKLGKPEDIATLVAFLASDEADFITGQNYPVCGLSNLGLMGVIGR